MPQCCAVPLCSEKKGGHKFPRDKNQVRKWLIAIRRDNWNPTNNSRICKKHFGKDDYEMPKDSVLDKPRPVLKKDAVPSRFSWNEASSHDLLQEKCETRAQRIFNRDAKRKNIENVTENSQNNMNNIVSLDSDCVRYLEVEIIECEENSKKSVGIQCDLCQCPKGNSTLKK